MSRGFEKRQELDWMKVYRLWAVQVKDPLSFDQFIGRAPLLSVEEKFNELWEMLERDRARGKHAQCTAS